MDFARDQLSKHGWTEGQGLGRSESGITEAIKVKNKQNKTGVGHDPGEEFSYHWWDHVFNKAASKIEVKTTENGVEVQNTSDTHVTKNNNYKSYCDKKMLYGQFVKGSTLSNGTVTEEAEDVEKEDENDDLPKVHCLLPDQADKVFEMCGGRTAHKGARHGLKLNGKLQRIEEQERLLLEKYMSLRDNTNNKTKTGDSGDSKNDMVDTTKTKKKKKDKKRKRDLERIEQDENGENPSEDSQLDNIDSTKTKKKDKKRKRDLERIEREENGESPKTVDEAEGGLNNFTENQNNLEVNDVEQEERRVKKRKKIKKNKKDRDTVADDDVNNDTCKDDTSNSNDIASERKAEDSNSSVNGDVKKRKKKDKKRKHDIE